MVPTPSRNGAPGPEFAIDAPSVPVHWHWQPLGALAPGEVHAVLALRAAVFVLEQQCVFVDPDAYDLAALHLLGFAAATAHAPLIAYLRMLPSGVKYAEPSIGRVITAPSHRRIGLGRTLMLEGVRRTRLLFPGMPIRIAAQERLQRFYESLGFVIASAPYVEDGIAHIEMLLDARVAVA